MEAIATTFKRKDGTRVPGFVPACTIDEAYDSDSCGFCLACGQDTCCGVEPDAREYECESCGKPMVYGIQELAIMGLLRITEE